MEESSVGDGGMEARLHVDERITLVVVRHMW